MARAGDEADAQAFDVVVGVVERVDLELAAVAGPGVDLADRQRLPEDREQVVAWMRRVSASTASSGAAAPRSRCRCG
jgi:hypothetical protein